MCHHRIRSGAWTLVRDFLSDAVQPTRRDLEAKRAARMKAIGDTAD